MVLEYVGSVDRWGGHSERDRSTVLTFAVILKFDVCTSFSDMFNVVFNIMCDRFYRASSSLYGCKNNASISHKLTTTGILYQGHVKKVGTVDRSRSLCPPRRSTLPTHSNTMITLQTTLQCCIRVQPSDNNVNI